MRLVAHMSYPTGEYPVECNIELKGLHQLKEGIKPLMGIQAMHNDTGFLLDQL